MDEMESRIRDEVRAFLATDLLRPDDLPDRIGVLREWQRQLYDAGLVGIAWPRELGGRGGTSSQQLVANLELARAGAPEPVGVIGLEVVGPSILAYASAEQQHAYARRILTAEDIWCQGFSEPEAGSD